MYLGKHMSSADFEPWQDSYKSHMANVEKFTPGMGQIWRGVMSCQLEMWGFASGRARAMLDYPSRLSHCKTPTDIVAENMRVAHETFCAYSESSQRLLGTFSQAYATPPSGSTSASWFDVWADLKEPADLHEEPEDSSRGELPAQPNGATHHRLPNQAAA